MEIKFQAPHAIDATLSPSLRLRDGVEIYAIDATLSPSLRLRDGVKVDNLTHWISTHRWHAPPEMCYLPFGLKRRWHNALRPLVEQWIGNVELEDTDLYGLRRYTRGSTLLPHVDREETHAASVIVCVEIKILRRVRAESSRRSPRHRRDACSMAWRCRFLAARPSQDGRVITEK